MTAVLPTEKEKKTTSFCTVQAFRSSENEAADKIEKVRKIAGKILLRNIKKYFDMAFNGEPVIVPRKENKNVVIVSEKDYKELEKARNNAAYLARLDLADEQIRQGKVVVKTMDELEAMAAE